MDNYGKQVQSLKKSIAFTGDFLPKLIRHQRQGTLDGACGFYCVTMILDYFDVCDPFDAKDMRTNLGKYLSSLSQRPLLTSGLTIRDLQNVIEFFTSETLKVERACSQGDFNHVKEVVQCQ